MVSEQLRNKVDETISIKPKSVDGNIVKTSDGDASAVLSGTSSVQGIEPLVPRPVVENLWLDPRSLETSGDQGAVGGVSASSSASSGILRSDSTLGDEAYNDATTKSAEESGDDEGARIQKRAKSSFSRWSSSSQSVLASLMTVHQGGSLLARDSDAGRSPSTTELSVLK